MTHANQRNLVSIAIALGSLVFASTAVAQPQPCGQRGSGGWGPSGGYGRLYNPKTVETVSGRIVAIDRVAPRQGMSPGLHLTLDMGKTRLAVHLGPAWYVDRQDTQLKVGDPIGVTGSRVRVQKRTFLIAASVRSGANTLYLRDKDGVPAWAGWRARPRWRR